MSFDRTRLIPRFHAPDNMRDPFHRDPRCRLEPFVGERLFSEEESAVVDEAAGIMAKKKAAREKYKDSPALIFLRRALLLHNRAANARYVEYSGN